MGPPGSTPSRSSAGGSKYRSRQPSTPFRKAASISPAGNVHPIRVVRKTRHVIEVLVAVGASVVRVGLSLPNVRWDLLASWRSSCPGTRTSVSEPCASVPFVAPLQLLWPDDSHGRVPSIVWRGSLPCPPASVELAGHVQRPCSRAAHRRWVLGHLLEPCRPRFFPSWPTINRGPIHSPTFCLLRATPPASFEVGRCRRIVPE